jgi:hypothetical protein
MNANSSLVALVVILGSAKLAAWVVQLADELLDRFTPKVKVAYKRWAGNRALRRALANAKPASPAEKRAMREGAEQAIAAFRRAEAALIQARREMAV